MNQSRDGQMLKESLMERLPSGRKACPSCRSQEVSRSHRRGLAERYLLSFLQIRPYRCAACDHRFYGRETLLQRVADRTA